MSIPAGIEGMPLRRFVLLTAIGSGIWKAASLGVSWAPAGNRERVQRWTGPASSAVVGPVVLAVRRHRGRQPTGR